MRKARLKADPSRESAFYHCISRIVERRYEMGPDEREHFLRLMRGYEAFCGVKILTFCVLSTHFHILVEVPSRPSPELLPDDKTLVSLLRKAGDSYGSGTLKQNLKRFREEGQHKAAEELRERFFCRMWDVSWFMRLLKQRFSQWMNRGRRRTGTLWEGRFRSVLVEGKDATLATIATYIDLNPVRASMVTDPKDYRWCGYAEAVGGGRLAREGLRVTLEARVRPAIAPNQVMAQYRIYLFESGQSREAGTHGEKRRAGFSTEQIQATLAAGGKLKLSEAIHCRVRYFNDGMILGSRAFVDRVFESHRAWFGKKRQTGARKMQGIDAPELFVARALEVRLYG